MLTKDQKNAIVSKIQAEDTTGSGYLLSSLGSYLKTELGIDWKMHTTAPGQNMRAWLTDHVSGSICTNVRCAALHPLPEVLDDGTVVCAPELRDTMERINELIAENLSDNGTIPLTRLQQLMLRNDLGSWRQLQAPGENVEKMYLWAKERFSRQYTVENDGPTWFLRRRTDLTAGSSSDYPMEIDPNDPDSLYEVKRMMDFAYMGSMSRIRQVFRRLTGYSGNQDAVWRAIVARKINNALNRPQDSYWEHPSPDGRPQAAVRMDGLTTPSGRQLYLVFVENTVSGVLENGKLPQKWRLAECCYSGQPGCGVWLYDALHIPVEEDRAVVAQREQTRQLLDDMLSLQSRGDLSRLLLQAGERVQSGLPLPEGLAELVRRYDAGWKKLTGSVDLSGLDGAEDGVSLLDIQHALSGSQAALRQLSQARTRLCALIEAVRTELVSTRLIPDGDDSVPAQDISRVAGWDDEGQPADGLLQLLDLYGQLCRAGELEVLDSAESERMVEIADHLHLSFRTLATCFVGQHVLTAQAQQARQLADDIRRAALELSAREDEGAVFDTDASPADRRKALRDVFTQDHINVIELAGAFKPLNDFEAAVVSNDRPAMEALAGDGGAMAAQGYSPEEVAAIRKKLQENPHLPRGSAPLFVGARLHLLQGNRSGQAEHYWLTAGRNNTDTLLRLLTLYRLENRPDDFSFVYIHCPKTLNIRVEERHYMLKCCNDRGDYAATVQTARSSPELLYQSVDGESNLELIRYAASQCSDQALLEHCQEVSSHFYANFDTDRLEDALIDNDLQTVEYLLSSPDELTDYSEQELRHLREALRSGALNADSRAVEDDGQGAKKNDFETGMRIWRALGNRRGLAEYFMWRGLLQDQLALQIDTMVFPLLRGSPQPRWRELIVLYEAYQPLLSHQESCRRQYLQALCAEAPQRAVEFSREHLVDAISCRELSDEIDLYEPVRGCCAQYDPLLADLLKSLHDAAMGSEFYASVIRCSPQLRDFVVQSDSLSSLGFTPEDVERISGAFRSGRLPHEQDPAGVAERLFLFLLDRDGLAEQAALFSCEDSLRRTGQYGPSAQLLVRLRKARGDWEGLLRLFLQQEELRLLFPAEYAETLVRTHQYETYAKNAADFDKYLPKFDLRPFGLIAALRTSPPQEDNCAGLLPLPASYVESQPEEMLSLSRWLYEQGMLQSWTALVPRWFSQALAAYTTEQLTQLLSAGGLLSPDGLARSQSRWAAEDGCLEAAIFAHAHLGAPSMGQKATDYYDAAAGGEGEPDWTRLEKLFPDKIQSIRLQAAMDRIRALARDGGLSPEEKLSRIQPLLTEQSFSPHQLWELTELLDAQGLLPSLIGPLRTQCVRGEEVQWDVLQVLSDALVKLSSLDDALLPDARAVWEALLQGEQLSGESLNTVCALCETSAGYPPQAETVNLLRRLYLAGGRQEMADTALCCLYQLSDASVLPPSLHAVLSEQPKRPLLDILRSLPPEEQALRDYMHNARIFAFPLPEDYAAAASYAQDEGDQPCSEEEAEAILRLLYAGGENTIWPAVKNLPLQEQPELRLELLLLGARHAGGSLWSRCASFAAGAGLELALPRILTLRLQTASNQGAVFNAEKQLRSVLHLDEYDSDIAPLPFLTDPACREQMEKLLDALCHVTRYFDSSNYSAIRRHLCIIASFCVKTNCEPLLLERYTDIVGLYFEGDGQSALALFLSLMLLAGHAAPAQALLHLLPMRSVTMYYHQFFLELEQMSTPQLEECIRQPGTRMLLKLLLPDGIRPSYDRLSQEMVWPALSGGDPQELLTCAQTLLHMMELTPNDQPLALALFLICKQDFPGRLMMLYQAEYLMCYNMGVYGEERAFHFRAREANAQLCDLILLGCLLNRKGLGAEAYGGVPSRELYNRLLDNIRRVQRPAELADRWTQAMVQTFSGKKEYNFTLIQASQIFDFYSRLDNCQDDDLKDLEGIILARVTGCWKDEMLRLFREGKNLKNYTEWLQDIGVQEMSAYHSTGMLRGILQAWHALPQEQRPAYLEWLRQQGNQPTFKLSPPGSGLTMPYTFRPGHFFYQALYLLERHTGTVSDNAELLQLPLEETGINFRLITGALHSFTGERWTGREYDRLSQRVLLTALIQNDFLSASTVAHNYFLQGTPSGLRLAYIYYGAICRAVDPNSRCSEQLRGSLLLCSPWNRAEFQACCYVCQVLLRIPPESPASFQLQLNGMIQMIYNSMSARLPDYLSGIPVPDFRLLLRVYPIFTRPINSISEEDQLAFAASFPSGRESLILRLLQQLNRQMRLPARAVAERIQRLRQQNAGSPATISLPAHWRLDPGKQVSPEELERLTEQARQEAAQLQAAPPREPAPVQTAPHVPAGATAREEPQEDHALPFQEPDYARLAARELSGLSVPGDREALDALYQEAVQLQSRLMTSVSEDRTQLLLRQRQVRYLIYCTCSPEERAAACLNLGVAEWYWQRQRMQTEHTGREQLDAVLFQLAAVGHQCGTQTPGYRDYAKIPASALYDLLLNGYSNLEKLIDIYQNNRTAFQYLLEPISNVYSRINESAMDGLNMLFPLLEQIADAFQLPSDELRIRQLESLLPSFADSGKDYNKLHDWLEVFTRLKGLLSTLVAGMRDRPRLSIAVLNAKSDAHGAVYGEIVNEGTRDAEELCLSVSFSEGVAGGEYLLSRLRRGAAAAFCIRFNAPSGCASLSCTLTVRYGFDGQTVLDRPCTCTVDICPKERPVLPPAPYPTNAVENFTVTEDGDVTSPLMVGREREKKQLRALVSGSFSSYQDALVCGFRRVGKTTLLNYLFHYIEHNGKQEKVIPIMVTCQDIRSAFCIQATFIDCVLAALPYTIGSGYLGSSRQDTDEELQDVMQSKEWSTFKASWALPPDAKQDRSANDIKQFYVELSTLLKGRRFVLVLDELDYLFSLVEETQGVDNGLLHVLDTLVDDMLLHRLIHFIFCGSNKIIRYSMDGGVLSQIFQRITTIKVGSLSYDDIRTRLLLPCLNGKYTMRYTEEAIRRIYSFTGGAIWHTLVMGTSIVDYKLSEEKRSTVYPSDVYDSQVIQSVIADSNCRQFREGCREVELQILKVMQRSCPYLDAAVDIAQIRAGLPEDTSPSAISSALSLLCALGLIKPGRYAGGECYQFSNELYRVFFRKEELDQQEQSELLFRPSGSSSVKTSGESAKELQDDIDSGNFDW